jgi:ABC-type branched-subunit amino acid transport system permease subunit
MRVMKSTHRHPKPRLDRLTQYGAAALIIVMLLAAVFQIVLAVAVAPALLFVMTAIITLLLIPFVLMLTTSTPAVTVAPEGITIEPLIWKSQFVPWQQVKAVKNYPLVPQADTEFTRKAMSGRKRYRPAAGIMLVIPSLPPQYRITGLLTGEGFTSVIAVTTRTHHDYDRLVEKIFTYVEQDAA